MTRLCCCTSPRSPKPSSLQPKAKQPAIPKPPPPVRLPGPLTLNPVVAPLSPQTSPTSMSSLHTAAPIGTAPVEPVTLGLLVVEDSDSDGELDPNSQTKSTSTLQLVKTRIRRHLSQESLPRRKRRSAAGSSQEEIDRRAELKRLMHKRIQEELTSEQGQETPESEASSSHRPVGPVKDYLPGGGPRDNLEFSVVEDTIRLEKPGTAYQESDPTVSLIKDVSFNHDENSHPDERRASCPESYSPINTSQNLLRERSSLPQMPSSPDLVPKRLPSTRSSSSLASWRLSYSAAQLDEFLGSIDRDIPKEPGSFPGPSASPISKTSTSKSPRLPLSDHSLSAFGPQSSPNCPNTPNNERSSIPNHSPLGTWLRSQGLRSRSPSRTSEQSRDPDTTIQDAKVVYLRRWSSAQNCTVVVPDVSRPQDVHLYDMDIHHQLVTRTLNTPEASPGHSDSGRNTVVRRQSKNSSGSNKGDGEQPEAAGNALDGQHVPVAVQEAPNDVVTTSSSVYPSSANSVYPSPGESSFHLADPPVNWKNMLAFSGPEFIWLNIPYNPHLVNKSARSSQPTTGASLSNGPATCTQTQVPPSLPFSEASPKTQEGYKSEATIEKSIQHFRLGHGAPAMIAKRFRKQAEDEPESPDFPRPSLLARLRLTIPRKVKLEPTSLDGADPDNYRLPSLSKSLLTVGPISRPHSRVSEDRRSPGLAVSDGEAGAAELWQRAIREEARRRNAAARKTDCHRRNLSFPDVDLHKKKHSAITSSAKHHSISPMGYKDSRSGGVFAGEPPITAVSMPAVEKEYVPFPGRFSGTPSPAPEKGTNDGSKGPVKFPDSWARFPSYNRGERNGLVEQANQVVQRDLAIRSASELNVSKFSTERNIRTSSERIPKLDSKNSIHGRLGRAVKSGFSKLIHSRSSASGDSPKSTKERQKCQVHDQYRSSSTEHPELELRSVEDGYQEIKALEREIQHMKGSPQLRCPVPLRQDMGPGDKEVSLNAKMTALLHTDGTCENNHEPAPKHMAAITPGNRMRGHSTTTTTDRFVTPRSAMSVNHSNDNTSTSSFHSFPQSMPASPVIRTRFPFLAGDIDLLAEINKSTDTITSVKSDTEMAFAQKIHRQLLSASGGAGSANFSVDTDADSAARFNPWSGRSRSHPVLR
ncbi:hypothetical protein B0H66DRAFT_318357 [Apodospora peruviana]|uniref:Uncharacterized protein n=1 Tax=Apodospora peruviana TaxID=516989 RepID=A0AAE0HXM5_9PEZI|nr:hypothetical protein B0H66DRAFT_318357 [Apodospora peruviana]